MKKLMSVFLLVALTLSLTACPASDGPNGPNGGEEVDWTDKLDATPTENAAWRTSDGGWDFGEEDFVISYSSNYAYEIYGKADGTWIENKVHQRNAAVEDRFNINIVNDQEIQATGTEDLTTHYTAVLRQFTQGDVQFDLLSMMAYQSGKLVLGSTDSGNFCDWRSEIPYCKDSIKNEEAWWPASLNKDCSINGYQFVAVSDISLTSMEMCYAVVFNQELVSKDNIASQIKSSKTGQAYSTMFDVVRGGDWTLDIFTQVTKDIYIKSSANQTDGMTADDIYGLAMGRSTDVDAWAAAFGIRYVENDGVNEPTLWTPNNKIYTAIEKLQEFYYTTGAYNTGGDTYSTRIKFFAEGHAYFALLAIEDLSTATMRGMENQSKHPFGVLPYPKYDTNQTEYYTGSRDHCNVLAVPCSVLDQNAQTLTMVGAITEALSAYNCSYVKEQYYETILTHQNVSDSDSVEMIDLIIKGRIYDISTFHYEELRLGGSTDVDSLGLFFRHMIHNPNSKPSTYWASGASALESSFEDLIDRYSSITGK